MSKVFERSFLEGAKRKEPKPAGQRALCAPGRSPIVGNLGGGRSKAFDKPCADRANPFARTGEFPSGSLMRKLRFR
jgi:hypothetical protein